MCYAPYMVRIHSQLRKARGVLRNFISAGCTKYKPLHLAVFRFILCLIGWLQMAVIWDTGFDRIWHDMDNEPRGILNDPFDKRNLGTESDSKVGNREHYANAVYSVFGIVVSRRQGDERLCAKQNWPNISSYLECKRETIDVLQCRRIETMINLFGVRVAAVRLS